LRTTKRGTRTRPRKRLKSGCGVDAMHISLKLF
jgi:hypothetical protein